MCALFIRPSDPEYIVNYHAIIRSQIPTLGAVPSVDLTNGVYWKAARGEKDEGCKHFVTSTHDGTSQARGHITLFCAQIESLMTITGSSAIMMSDMALLSWTINS